MNLGQAPTPSLILDRRRLTRNCERMLAKCRSLGVTLRPHLKTLKSIDAARVAIDPTHGGVAVSTLREADYFAGHGIADIQYAVCITADKLLRAKEITKHTPGFSFFLDSVETARAVAAVSAPASGPFNVWIEIESGGRRTGIDPDDPALIEIARSCAMAAPIWPGSRLMGVTPMASAASPR